MIFIIATAITIFSILQFYFIVVRAENITRIEACDFILLGDSHTEYINDIRIYNFSFPGCSYQLHEKFIRSVPLDDKKVIINIAPHNLSVQYHNRYFSNDPTHDDWREKFFIDLPKAIELFRFKLSHEYSSVKLFKQFGTGKAINKNQKQDLSTSRLEYTLHKHFGDSTYTDTLEKNAFNRIVDFLIKSEVEYAVVQMPHHPNYWNNIPPRILHRYEETLRKFDNQIQYDFVNESHYFDGDHILGSYQGLYLNGAVLDEIYN